MTHLVAVLLALLASCLLCSAFSAPTPTTLPTPSSSPSSTHVTYFRSIDRAEWQLDTSAVQSAADLSSSSSSSSTNSSSSSSSSSSRASASQPVSFMWLFPLRNLDWLQAEVNEVHDPASPRFLQRQSEEYVDAKVGATQAEKDEVRTWLLSNGVADSSIADWRHSLKVDTTVGVVEALFSTEMHRYRHATNNRTATVARTAVKVPAALAPRLLTLEGVYKFPHTIYSLHAVRTTPRSTKAGDSDGAGATKTDTDSDSSSIKQQPSSSSSEMSRFKRNSLNVSHTMHVMQTEETNAQCPSNFQGGFFGLLSPASLATLYNFAERASDTTAQSTRAAVAGGFGGTNSNNQDYYEAYSQADLTHFQTNVGFSHAFSAVDYNGNNAANLQTNARNTGVGPTTEASLDIDALFQVSPTSTNGFYAVTGTTAGLYQSLAGVYQLSSSVRPQAISYSYSFGVSDWDYTVDDAGATESMLTLLANAGVTVIASAGDDGAPSSYNTNCAAASTVSSTAAPTAYRNSVMLPQYPASSPNVLSVAETQFLYGATSLSSHFSSSITSPPECNNCPPDQQSQGALAYLCQSSFLPETAVSVTNTVANDGTTTGGGFSFKFAQPSWQQSVVSSYLGRCSTSSCALPPSSQYNAANRAYPDVAAFGGYFAIVVDGQESIVSGTSVSAPLWAGFIARLNEAALVKYGTTLGLVAPLLYNMSATQPNTFNDITTGNNVCPRDNSQCVTAVNSGGSTSCHGFYGAAGWDPVTGLGSPNVNNMISFLNGGSSANYFGSSGRNAAAATTSSATACCWLLVMTLLAAAALQWL